jgi:hypothetical protein
VQDIHGAAAFAPSGVEVFSARIHAGSFLRGVG